MNSPKVNEYDYINFLIATQKGYSCLEAERVQPDVANSPTDDAITRLLHRIEPKRFGALERSPRVCEFSDRTSSSG